jgi:hypothetical protein
MKQANLNRLNATVTGHSIFDNVPKPRHINA